MGPGVIVLPFGDGEYAFELRGKHIEELQRLCGFNGQPAAFFTIANRVLGNDAFYRDIYEAVRLGLVGGGTPAQRALELARLYIEKGTLADPDIPGSPLWVCRAVLQDAMYGLDSLAASDGTEKKTAQPSP